VNEFIARITVLELHDHKKIMSQGYSSVLHMHTNVREIEISQIMATYKDGKPTPSSFLLSGQQGIVKILVMRHSSCLTLLVE